ncbi:enoyl-CoA hydratase/isomerase family protein [Sphingomonas profundi]|uniref:enoyl-CoA hydratase/isomerase family protein n=1 Tax=Alterirhizorhabdus profundi TaxID=2681549 RepID=UPI0012E8AB06|nr:enoyl-CoA hydratase/isomerase family protein [Sphingomonas profundi]
MFDLTTDGRVARLTLNRPAARNAIPQAGWAALTARLGEIGAARVLILDAAGSAFCAGADLTDLARLAGDAGAAGRFRATMGAATAAIRALPIPVIAAIDGGCFGAGVALAMACDIRIAGRGAGFAIPPARLGITYPFGDVARLVALVGPGQAARLLHGGGTIDADEAARIGLVEQAVEHAGEAAAALAQAIAANAPASVAALKGMIARAGEAGDAVTDALFDDSFAGPAFAEGIAAMQGRRRPDFA